MQHRRRKRLAIGTIAIFSIISQLPRRCGKSNKRTGWRQYRRQAIFAAARPASKWIVAAGIKDGNIYPRLTTLHGLEQLVETEPFDRDFAFVQNIGVNRN